MVEDFLFFYFLILIRDNFRIMNTIRFLLKKREKISFSYLDAILIYYYVVVGLQSEFAFQFIEKYWKKYFRDTSIPFLPPPISV